MTAYFICEYMRAALIFSKCCVSLCNFCRKHDMSTGKSVSEKSSNNFFKILQKSR